MGKIQMSNQKKKYREKPSKEIIEKIKNSLVDKTKTASQLSKEYNIPRSTINSYLKAKGNMYNQLNSAISQKLHELVDMNLDLLKNLKMRERKLYIKEKINNLQLFQFSDCNPFKMHIPKTKIDSHKIRQIQNVVKNALDYFSKTLQKQQPQNDHQIEILRTQDIDDENLILEDFLNPIQGDYNENFEVQSQNYPTDQIEFVKYFTLEEEEQYNSNSYFDY